MLDVNNIEKSWAGELVLKNVTFTINRGDKVALIGVNGSGKSTLLKIIAGLVEPDLGNVKYKKGIKVGYLEQEIEDNADLSSGEKIKNKLELLFNKNNDLYILDEPTNNLDTGSLNWLNNKIKNSTATFLIVSHDRYFLDNVINRIVEINAIKNGKVEIGNNILSRGNYSDYTNKKKIDYESSVRDYDDQQILLKRLNSAVVKRKESAKRGSTMEVNDKDKLTRGFMRDKAKYMDKKAKALETRISKIKKIEKPILKKPLKINLDTIVDHATLDIKYEDEKNSVYINYGQHILITGKNGSGKTTLLNSIISKIYTDQKKDLQKLIKIGDLISEFNDFKNTSMTVIDFINSRSGEKIEKEIIYNELKKFGINDKRINQPISFLSAGLRFKLILALFSLIKINTLILDEPTNHLDLEAQDALIETINNFLGTIILVTHDQHLINSIKIDSRYEIIDGKIKK